MARKRIDAGFKRIGTVAMVAMLLESAGADAQTCKQKTAGFFLQYAAEETPRRLAIALQKAPPSLTGIPGNPESGRLVLVNPDKGGCLSCHKVSALAAIAGQGGIGPSLDGTANRYNEDQIRQFVVDPKVYVPDTVMPSYRRPDGQAAVLSAAEVEDLVAYLKTFK